MKVPEQYLKNLAGIKNVLKNAKNKSFFIAGHQRPDGDTIGSTLALYSLLRRIKKKVFLYSCDPVPSFLRFLPYSEKIKISKKVKGKFDVAIILECAEISRLDGIINVEKHARLERQAKTTVNIDHHIHKINLPDGRQAGWADINWLDSCSSSIAEMIFYIFKFLKMSLTKEEAISLYTGIVTDTHNFKQANTTAQSHIITSELLGYGVEPTKVEKYVYGTKTSNVLHLLGTALSRIKTDKTGKIAYTTVTRKDFRKTGTTVEDTEDIVNYAGMTPAVLVWMLFREMSRKNHIKVSFRSAKEIDVNRIASKFGGGGHKNAAGCIIKGTINNVIAAVIPVVRKELKK